MQWLTRVKQVINVGMCECLAKYEKKITLIQEMLSLHIIYIYMKKKIINVMLKVVMGWLEGEEGGQHFSLYIVNEWLCCQLRTQMKTYKVWEKKC